MTLTPEQSALLCAPFASQDHEFKPPRGYIYIAEIAICQRIEQVDLSWELRVESVTRNDPRGALATSIAHLTICGITRSGVGMQAVEFQKGTDVESGEAEKGATTDAMKRAARLFGIGRYLLDCPKGVKDYGPDLDKWLKSLSRQQQAPTPMIKAPAPIEPAKPEAPQWWSVLKEVKPKVSAEDFEGIVSDLKRGLYEDRISMSMSDTNVRTMLFEEFGVDIRKKKSLDMSGITEAEFMPPNGS